MEKKATKKAATKKTSAKKKAPSKKVKAASDHPIKVKAKTARKASGKPCKIKSCKRAYRAKGYCVAHYRQWRHGKFGKNRYTRCHDYGCTKPMAMNRHGLCEEHFQNYYVKGMERTAIPVAEKPAKAESAA